MRSETPPAIQYLLLYALGTMKSAILSPPFALMQNHYLDVYAWMRFVVNLMGPEETLQFVYPQMFSVSDPQLSEDSPPPMLNLLWSSFESQGIYVVFNALFVYLWVGRDADSQLLALLFGVDQYSDIDMHISEEEVFQRAGESAYVAALQGLVNSLRTSRILFAKLRVLLQGERESERDLTALLVEDNKCSAYQISYEKFMDGLVGGKRAMPY